ncbi:hypothetical protein L249_0054 [Ophiocordyceps polyrhachis-furcata BCC 54312]|uniref:C3H1-type domain-containing protein n=1 Tax=Ophiocordyceps polyrhachis-furcata BCC 54312 TaxID=1330021 RepID=A0A367LFT1_9HYPO|nr:hypothetical protein L249_0054 [Ophiocordyceps polyrhachis-furcata BCC 54312]
MTMMMMSLHCWSLLTVLLAGGVLWSFAIAVYRIFFHPLAKYPGPLLAKVTNIYQLYYAYRGDRHLEFWRMHQRYGKIVRFGPNAVSFNSNQALKEIYGFRSNVRKADFYDAFVHPAANTHNTRDKDTHARKRRVLSHAFSDSAMRAMQRYILANVRTFCEQIGVQDGGAESKGWSRPRNMTDWCNYLAMDILGDLSFGKAFHMLEQPDNRFALDLVEAAASRHLICGTMPVVDRLKIDRLLFPKLAAGRARYMAYSKSQLTERTKLGEETDRRDFFYYLLKARDPETGLGFSTPELWGESNLLIIAGSDTTSTAMAATLFYLVRNQPALERATAEVRSKFQQVEDIVHGPALGSCTYLRACIDEAMRLSPSVGGILPREVLAGGISIECQSLPAGTVVGTPHYAIHHNQDYYPMPFSFAPERWLVGETNPITERVTTEDDLATAQSAFCPFSVGPRGCIGKGLAYVEMTTALARTLFMYDLRRAVGVEDPGEGRVGAEWGRHRVDEFQLRDTFTSAKNGPMVEFRRADMFFASQLRSLLHTPPSHRPPSPFFHHQNRNHHHHHHSPTASRHAALKPILPDMAVCRFFQQGNCKFGNNCRFEHPAPRSQSQPNRFSALSSATSSAGRGPQAELLGKTQSPSSPTRTRTMDAQLTCIAAKYSISAEAITRDLTIDKPPWILSAYAPGREAPEQLFGGFPREQSFEEVKLHYMLGKASGNEQQALNEAQQLYRTAEQQIENALKNIDAAANFVAEAENRHPNRHDICRNGTQGAPFGQFRIGRQPKPLGNPSPLSNPFAGSSPSPSSNPFGQPSAAQSNPFARASQPSTSPFGQPSQTGGAGAFSQAVQPTSAFGQPTALGPKPNPFAASSAPQPNAQGNTFGVTSQLGHKTNPFAQVNSATSPFASLPAGDNAAAARSPFSAPAPQTNTTANPFSTHQNNSAGGAFAPQSGSFASAGQPQAQGTGRPFAPQSGSFASAGQPQAQGTGRPFGQTNGVFGQPATNNNVAQQPNPFGAPAAQQQPRRPSEMATTGPYPPGSTKSHPPLGSYCSRDASGRLTAFKGKPVAYNQGLPGTRGFDGTWTRIWFPDGPPMYSRDTELPQQQYDEKSMGQWEAFAKTGAFADGIMPELPPPRECTLSDEVRREWNIESVGLTVARLGIECAASEISTQAAATLLARHSLRLGRSMIHHVHQEAIDPPPIALKVETIKSVVTHPISSSDSDFDLDTGIDVDDNLLNYLGRGVQAADR